MDALCISQKDDQEKSDQIRHITQIYSRAEATYAWRGGADYQAAASALNLVGQLPSNGSTTSAPSSQNQDPIPQRLGRSVLQRGGLSPSEPQDIESNTTVDNHGSILSRLVDNMSDLLACEYSTRRWILQEVAVSRKVYVCCAEEILDLKSLNLVLKRRDLAGEWNLEPLNKIFELRGQFQAAETRPLCEILITTPGFKSERVHDRLYAVLGIGSDGNQLIPIPSYSLDTGSLLAQITKLMVLRYMSFNFMLIDDRDRSKPSACPTWVPDLLSCNIDIEAYNSATIQRGQNESYVMQAFQGPLKKIMLQGTTIGTIVALASAMGTTNTADNTEEPVEVGANLQKIDTTYYDDDNDSSTVAVTCALIECLVNPSFEDWPDRLFRSPSTWYALLYGGLNQRYYDISRSGFYTGVRPPVLAALNSLLRSNQHFSINGIEVGKLFEMKSSRYLSHLFWDVASTTLGFMTLLILVPVIFAIIVVFSIIAWDSIAKQYDIRRSIILYLWLILVIGLGLFIFFKLVFRWGDLREDLYTRRMSDEIEWEPRRIAFSDTGMISATCLTAAVGDKICLVAGCSTAVVLRRYGENSTSSANAEYQLMGNASTALSAGHQWSLAAFEVKIPWPPSGQSHQELDSNRRSPRRLGRYPERGIYERRLDLCNRLIRKHQAEAWWEKFTIV